VDDRRGPIEPRRRGNLFNEVYGVTPNGNFNEPHQPPGQNILSIVADPETIANKNGLSLEQLDAILDEARRKLFTVRERRARPGRDEKVLAAWNGLMLAAFAEAAAIDHWAHGRRSTDRRRSTTASFSFARCA
jgi:uncharacterized protein YyaL (SSP411 family)